jgi:hypothetical protein
MTSHSVVWCMKGHREARLPLQPGGECFLPVIHHPAQVAPKRPAGSRYHPVTRLSSSYGWSRRVSGRSSRSRRSRTHWVCPLRRSPPG